MQQHLKWPWLQCGHIHWKCVLCCGSNLPCNYLPYQESDMNHSNASPSIRFHIYHLITLFKVHGRRQLDEDKSFVSVFKDIATGTPAKLHTRKSLL